MCGADLSDLDDENPQETKNGSAGGSKKDDGKKKHESKSKRLI